MKSKSIEVVVGTYEHFVLGYKIKKTEDDQYQFFQTFVKQSHTGSVKTVATSNIFLASGGDDNKIVIYDMENQKELQTLLHHTGPITSLSFTPGGSHLMTTSEDGSIFNIRCDSWVVEKKWPRAHAGSSVKHLTVSNGNWALTLGNDFFLRAWNLVGGQDFETCLNCKTSERVWENVEWSIDGKTICLTGAKFCIILSIETNGLLKSISCQSNPICIAWINETTVAIGMVDGNLMIADINREKDIIIRAYEKCVEAIKFLNGKLVTVCSTGEVTMWSVTPDNNLEKMCSIEIDCRPTCIALIETDDAGDLVKEETTEIKEKNLVESVDVDVETIEMKEINDEIAVDNANKIPEEEKDDNNLVERPTVEIVQRDINMEDTCPIIKKWNDEPEIDDLRNTIKKIKSKKLDEAKQGELSSKKKVKNIQKIEDKEPEKLLRSSKKKIKENESNDKSVEDYTKKTKNEKEKESNDKPVADGTNKTPKKKRDEIDLEKEKESNDKPENQKIIKNDYSLFESPEKKKEKEFNDEPKNEDFLEKIFKNLKSKKTVEISQPTIEKNENNDELAIDDLRNTIKKIKSKKTVEATEIQLSSKKRNKTEQKAEESKPKSLSHSKKMKIERRVLSSPYGRQNLETTNKGLVSAKKVEKPLDKKQKEDKASPKKKTVEEEKIKPEKSSENVVSKKKSKNKNKTITTVPVQEESKAPKNKKRRSMF